MAKILFDDIFLIQIDFSVSEIFKRAFEFVFSCCEFTKVIFCSKKAGVKWSYESFLVYKKYLNIFFTSEKLQEESKGKISEITDKIGTLSEKLERYFEK